MYRLPFLLTDACAMPPASTVPTEPMSRPNPSTAARASRALDAASDALDAAAVALDAAADSLEAAAEALEVYFVKSVFRV